MFEVGDLVRFTGDVHDMGKVWRIGEMGIVINAELTVEASNYPYRVRPLARPEDVTWFSEDELEKVDDEI